jgi:hypothetical protein
LGKIIDMETIKYYAVTVYRDQGISHPHTGKDKNFKYKDDAMTYLKELGYVKNEKIESMWELDGGGYHWMELKEINLELHELW